MDADAPVRFPQLVEQNVRHHMTDILSKCHSTRVNIYLYLFNFGILVLFLGAFGLILYYCYKRKLTPMEERIKNQKDQEYIVSKIKMYKEHKRMLESKSAYLPSSDTRPLW